MNQPVSTAVNIPAPHVPKRSGISLVWIVPIVVAAVGGWLIFKTLAEKGPLITIAFKTAAGIEAGKTKIRYKDMDIGLVDSVRFSDDFSHVLISAQMANETELFLRRETRFWVVKPRLGLRGVSGLSTLISGSFIEIEPGGGAEQRHFEGLEAPPVVKAEESGRRVTMVSAELGSIGSGSPMYYRGILAGEVLGHELGSDGKSVLVYGFIKAPFDKLVRGNTRFWNVSGVDVEVSSEGISVRTESIQSVLLGGIAFETPESIQPVDTDLDEVVFTLHSDKDSVEENVFTQRLRFVLFFDGSVRGLNIDAPVEFKGIKVGKVVDVRLEFDSRDTTFRIPVMIEIEPERVIPRGGTGEDSSPLKLLSTLVDRGLRARLQTGSLLTGQLFVELDMHPDTPIRLVNAEIPYPQLPTIPASLAEITNSVKRFLVKLDGVDLKEISNELLATLKGTNQLVNSQELTMAIVDAQAAVGSLRSILSSVEQRAEPISENIVQASAAGHEALAKVQTTLDLLNNVLRSDSPLQYRAIQMTDELTETLRSIRIFVDLLERNPESVIFGKPVPGAKK